MAELGTWLIRRTHRESERCAAVAVAFTGAGRPVVVFTVVNDLLHHVQILAHSATDRDAQFCRRFKQPPHLGKQIALEGLGEGKVEKEKMN